MANRNIKDPNTYDSDRNKSGSQNPADYSGYRHKQYKVQPISPTRPPTPPIAHEDKPTDQPDPRTPEGRSILLRKLVDAESMDIDEFVPLLKLTIEASEMEVARIEAAQEVVLYDGVNVTLTSDSDSALLQRFLGVDKVDEASLKCLDLIANYSPVAESIAAEPKTLDGAKSAVENAFRQEVIDENFPDFGIDLILFITYIVPVYIVILFFSQLCKLTTKIFKDKFDFSKVLTIGNVEILGTPDDDEDKYKIGLKISEFFKKVWNGAANCIIELHYWTHMALVKRPIVRNMMFGAKYCNEAVNNGRYRVNVCDKGDLNINVPVPELKEMIDSMVGAFFPAVMPMSEDCRGIPNRAPTAMEIAVARHLLDSTVREQLQAQVNNVQNNPQRGTPKNKSAYEYAILGKLKAEANFHTLTAKGIDAKLTTPAGNRIVDKVDGAILGVLVEVNGFMQRCDRAVNKVLALEFLPAQARVWVCCIVRLIFIFLPRISAYAKRKDNPTATLTAEDINPITPEFLNKYIDAASDDLKPYIDDAKAWVKIIQSLLNIISSSATLNIDLNLGKNIAAIFEASLKMAISEGASILVTALNNKLQETMFKALDDMYSKFPDMKLAIDSCPPFNWFMKMFQCSLQNFMAKIQALLASLWAEGAAMMEAIDVNISISATQGTFQLISDLFDLFLEWDQALLNFCSLKQTITEIEKSDLIEKILSKTNLIAPVDRMNDPKFQAALAGCGPVFSGVLSVGPTSESLAEDEELNRINAATENGNPLFSQALQAVQEAFLTTPPAETPAKFGYGISRAAIPDPVMALPQNEPWQPAEAIISCGDEFKAILRDRLDDIIEVHRTLGPGALTNFVTGAFGAPPGQDAASIERKLAEHLNK